MKKKLLLIFFIFILSSHLFAEVPFSIDLSFPITPSLQVGYGYEYVFDTESNTKKNRLLSQLDWPLLPALNWGFASNISIYKFNICFSTKFAIPSNTGNMRDIDFFNDNAPKMLTHLSMHKAFLKKQEQYNATIGWLFTLPTKAPEKNIKIFIEPNIGFRYFLHKWLATDGYTQYSPYPYNTPVTDKTPKVPVKGNVVEYTQKIFMPNIGFLLKMELPKNWIIKSQIQFWPQALATCTDNHFDRQTIFIDVFRKKGFSLNFAFFVEKKINRFLVFFFSAEATTIKSVNGKTIIKKAGLEPGILPEGASGTALYAGDFSFGISFKIDNKTFHKKNK